jgi:hypothetical protein
VDWLHSADQGVAADFFGNLLCHLVDKHMPGNTLVLRCAALWQEIQGLYEDLGITDRLQNLTIGMLRKSGKSPKLRASAAQTRALIGCAHRLATRLLDPADPLEQAMLVAATSLNECYSCLAGDSIFWEDLLPLHSRLFAAQLVALEACGDGTKWKVKPKLHLFLEMCSEGSKPSLVWTYRDEDFGGSCATMARRRGGLQKPGATSANLLTKFRIKNPAPRIR